MLMHHMTRMVVLHTDNAAGYWLVACFTWTMLYVTSKRMAVGKAVELLPAYVACQG